MKKGFFNGILMIAIGVFFIYWAQTHSPKDVTQRLGNAISGSYTLSETWYYLCLGLGAIFGIIGVLRTYKSMS